MSLLFDTNILIHIARHQDPKIIFQNINPNNQKIYISIVTIAEIKSIALQNNWSNRKWQAITDFSKDVIIVEVNENLSNIYAEIDAFSQRKNPSYLHYSFLTSRNMGKNDLWIASTAALLGLKLVTTDADFNHLHQVFMEVEYIKARLLK